MNIKLRPKNWKIGVLYLVLGPIISYVAFFLYEISWMLSLFMLTLGFLFILSAVYGLLAFLASNSIFVARNWKKLKFTVRIILVGDA